MDGWGIFWSSLTIAIIITDFIANRKKGATLSEHCREIFTGAVGAIVLGLTLFSFWVHIILKVNVYPLIVCGLLIIVLIRRKGKMFRWDKWLQGLGVGVGGAVLAGLGPIIADGNISKSEWWALLVLVITVAGAYMKTHPPIVE